MSELKCKLIFDGYWKEKNIINVPEQAGIYCVYTYTINEINKKQKLTIHKLVFIGFSENARSSVLQHETSGEFKKHQGDRQKICYSFAPLDKVHSEQVKLALIISLNPIANSDVVKKFDYDKTQISTEGQNNLIKSEIIVTKTM